VHRWHATCHWKALDNFASHLTSIGGLHTKLWACKVVRSQFWEFRDSNLGVMGQNDIWVLALWPGIENTIRRKVVASPKFGLWWVLWVRVCPWLIYAPKHSNYALTDLLFGLCKSMWVIELLVNLLSPHPRSSKHPSTPKVLWTKEYNPASSPSDVFTFGLAVECIKELGGASNHVCTYKQGC